MRRIDSTVRLAGAALAGCATLAACGGGDGPAVNLLPAQMRHHTITEYPATTAGTGATTAQQDLLTGGLGRTGLGAAAPAFADPANPTAAELRRNALHSNYRGIVDPTAGGGYGRLYGPNIDLEGNDTLGEGLIPGKEYLGTIDNGSGTKRVVVAVQIPASFDPANPCIVAGPSSGSRGVYGAIGSASEWGLKRGCAVALTDTGKGMGLYDPTDDTVHRIDGTRAKRSEAGTLAHFAADLSEAARTAFNAAFPNRLALKHAHSKLNPEADWGDDTLTAVRYALYALNREYGRDLPGNQKEARFAPGNTLVIAGSVSNGGSAVLRAAEQDTQGLIDGVVASEPNAQPAGTNFTVQAGGTPVEGAGKALIDYVTYANLYQPCAALAAGATMAETSVYNYIPLVAMTTRAENRCTALAARGLVSGADTAARAADALDKLRAYGWSASPEMDRMHNAHYALGNQPILATMYPNAYGRFGVEDNLCGMSVAATNATGDVLPIAAAAKAQSYATGNGTANGTPVTPVYNASQGGAKGWQWAVSPTSGLQDFGLDAALCQRALVTGKDPVTNADLTAASTPTAAQSQRVREGIRQVLLDGNLRGKPALIVHGRDDALVPVNHSSRAYAAFNRAVESGRSQLSYIEVTNAQHFDGFLPFSGFDNRFVPLHVYFNQAMNAMYAKLKNGTPLPPSQVVRATPRGGAPGAAPALTASMVPPFTATPAAGNRIDFTGATVNVPN